MKMQNWLNTRSAQLLTDINNTPNTDDSEEIKLQLILSAMRESSIEMFHRASENSRKEIEKINKNAMEKTIQEVENSMNDDLGPLNVEVAETAKVKVKKPESKIKLKSSVIRRVDSF